MFLNQKKFLYLVIFFTSKIIFASSNQAENDIPVSKCFQIFSNPEIRERMGSVYPSRSSVVQVDFPLVSRNSSHTILQKLIKTFGINTDTHFFSQFVLDPQGMLHTIEDPTFKKDDGKNLSMDWNDDSALRESLSSIYINIKSLEQNVRVLLPESEVELAEVVLTIQVNKVSENWHLDWYPQEYLIGTQTFIAYTLDPNGDLKEEDFAGTEYLLFGHIPEVLKIMKKRTPPISVTFSVNSNPRVVLTGTGFWFETPTKILSLHSGVKRVHKVLNIPENTNGYSLASPPHRGSYKNLLFRVSLAIRFKPSGSTPVR